MGRRGKGGDSKRLITPEHYVLGVFVAAKPDTGVAGFEYGMVESSLTRVSGALQ